MTLVSGRLQLLDVIGTGAGGPVWRAWDVVSRRQVAVHRHAAGEGRDVRHPHLLTPERIDGRIAVTELVRGGNAEQLLAGHGVLPVDYVAVLLDQLLRGLTALHDAGWVHGDVKPANLLLAATSTGRPHLLIADLASARRVGALVRPDGTPGYVAPERRAGGPSDPRQDLYALGATAAELLTGRVPRTVTDLRRTPLRPLVAALLATDPEDRPADARAARARLRQHGVPEGAPWRLHPHPPDVPDRFGGPRRRRSAQRP